MFETPKHCGSLSVDTELKEVISDIQQLYREDAEKSKLVLLILVKKQFIRKIDFLQQ